MIRFSVCQGIFRWTNTAQVYNIYELSAGTLGTNTTHNNYMNHSVLSQFTTLQLGNIQIQQNYLKQVVTGGSRLN